MNTQLTWIASGLAAGWLTRVAVAGRREPGVAGDLTLGMLGGIVAGWLTPRLGIITPHHAAGHVLVAAAGAVTLVGGVRALARLATTVDAVPAARELESDVERQLARLGELEKRMLARVLGGHAAARDPNRAFDEQLTFGERVADRVATFGGSWTFIGLFMAVLLVWMMANEQMTRAFDPYPFILLNLVLSCVAALQAPVIMMSQNRQAARDRLDARNDYEVNLRAELQIVQLHAKLDEARERDWAEMLRVQQEQMAALRRLEAALLERRGDSDV